MYIQYGYIIINQQIYIQILLSINNNYYNMDIMQQSQYKRYIFHQQIRQRQHDQIFKKIRANNQIYLTTYPQHNTQIKQLLKNLTNMYKLSTSISSIIDNLGIIMQYIKNIRKYQDNQQILKQSWQYYNIQQLRYREHDNKQNGVFVPFLQYMLQIVKTIYQHIMIDIQNYQSIEQQYQNRQIPYTQILLPISYLLINLTSQQLCINYLNIISQFMQYRIFIDSFHNIFLTQNMPIKLKQNLISQYLTQLQRFPLLFLNNCHIFIKVLFYSINQQPKILGLQFTSLHNRIFAVVQRINSILNFNTKLQDYTKKQYKIYCNMILQKLSLKNQPNCWKIANATSTMGQMSQMIGDLRGLFTAKGKFDENYVTQHLIGNTKVLSNLSYFDDIASYINQCYPLIWINLLTIFQRMSVQYWISQQMKTLPAIFGLPNFPTIVLKVLKCISNFVCIPQLCQNFITKQTQTNNKNKVIWINILTCIYNSHYKMTQVRVECLCILSNALLITAKTQAYCYSQNSQMDIYQNYHTLNILNFATDLIFQVLKLSNLNKNIILSVLKTLIAIVQKFQTAALKCSLFNDHSFINRLHSIADSNYQGNQYKKYDYYSDDVKLQAQYLLQAMRINH